MTPQDDNDNDKETHNDQYRGMTDGQPDFLKTFPFVLKTYDQINSCQKEAW